MSDTPHLVCNKCRSLYRGDFARCPRDGEVLEETTRDPLLDSTLAHGRYRVRGLLGEGGAGRVYEAVDLRLDRPYAIKVLFGDLTVFPDVVERFQREARAAARMDHPNVAAVIDHGLGADDEPSYLVMELARGRALSDLVKEDGPIDENLAWQILRGITAGLAHAHERGVIHRDLKPNNVILEPGTNRPRLVDFGVARLEHSAQPQLTKHGLVVGTPGFISPEVLRGSAPDERADLYGLGVTTWYCLFGKLPFGSGDDAALQDTLQGLDMGPLQTLEVSEALRYVVRALIDTEAEHRASSTEAFLAMLEAPRPRSPTPPAITPPESGEPELEPVQDVDDDPAPRSTRWPLALVAVLLLLGAGALTFMTADGPSEDASPVADAPASVTAAPLRAAPPRPSEASTATQTVAAESLSKPSRPVEAVEAAPAKRIARPKPAVPPPRVSTAPRRSAPAPRPTARTKPATAADLSAAYRRLGARLDALEAQLGQEAIASHRARYFDIPLADALRRPDRIPDVMQKIRRLQADLPRPR